jgi:hypothetical protein
MRAKLLACLAAMVVSGAVQAGFYENIGVTDEVEKPVVPSGFKVSDVTKSCVAHLRDRGYVFADQAEIDRIADEAKARRLAEIKPPEPIIQERIVYVERPLDATAQRCVIQAKALHAGAKTKKAKKRAKKPAQHSACN